MLIARRRVRIDVPHDADVKRLGVRSVVTSRSRSPRRAVTRADVARYAGVSTAVVSYVVNQGPRPVAASTAARVHEAIELLGYQPNLSARALKIGSTRMLGMVVSDISNPFFADFALEIEAEAGARGYALALANSHADAATESKVVADLIARQVDGLILASVDARPERLYDPLRFARDVVVIDCPKPMPGYWTIGANGARGSQLAVEHLIEVHGHSSVALVVGEAFPAADLREQGWQTATRLAGQRDGPIVRTAFSREGGYQAGLRLLQTRNPPTAVFTSSDLQAIGVLRAIRESGMRTPDDVAIVAFDGTEESEFCWPPLTVARQPVREMALSAVARVLEPSDDPEGHELFDMSIVVRQSCGCPAPAASAERPTVRTRKVHT